ncbi:MAG: chromate efflux transporter [Betaproteobacteria bacterium]|jgi:chromate transporter|nr:chromate efflux transporter [Rubrivivax sp.]
MTAEPPPTAPGEPPRHAPGGGSALAVFAVFLRLGLTSFGGPVAHLGYFRTEFVERRRWLDDRQYAELVALCQFLPGPASSQVGLALGLQRAGAAGALAAWAGFTLPSALLLMALALGLAAGGGPGAAGLVQGLKLVAVAVVAQAVWGMARSLCPDLPRAAIALAAGALSLSLPAALGPVAAIVLGAVAGRLALQVAAVAPGPALAPGLSRRTGAVLLLAAGALLVGLPLAAAAAGSPGLQAVSVFYQAGALVFGGGHVVLPLLQAGVVAPGWVSEEVFLAGYGAAQAVPGPLFSFAAFLGAALPAPLGGWAGGMAMLVALFAPGLLLVAGALPLWNTLRTRQPVRRALAGANAAVVGLLGAALLDPVIPGAIHSPADAALALAGFAALVALRWPPLAVVALLAGAGWALGA